MGVPLFNFTMVHSQMSIMYSILIAVDSFVSINPTLKICRGKYHGENSTGTIGIVSKYK